MRVCTRTGQQHHRNHISHHHHHPAQAHRAVRALQQTQAARRQRRSGPLARAQRSYATGAATASACRARAAAPHLEHDLELIATATQWHRITAVERAADSTDQAAADTHGTKHTQKNAADARQHTLTLSPACRTPQHACNPCRCAQESGWAWRPAPPLRAAGRCGACQHDARCAPTHATRGAAARRPQAQCETAGVSHHGLFMGILKKNQNKKKWFVSRRASPKAEESGGGGRAAILQPRGWRGLRRSSSFRTESGTTAR